MVLTGKIFGKLFDRVLEEKNGRGYVDDQCSFELVSVYSLTGSVYSVRAVVGSTRKK